MQACVSGLKVYKRRYVYWHMHLIAPPSEDNVGHVFKVQKTRMMLLHVFTCIQYVCVAMSMRARVCACMYCTCMCMCVHIVCMCKCLCASECTNVLSLLMQTIHACGVI